MQLGFPIIDVVVLVGILALSIGIDFFGHKENKEIGIKSALLWSVFWIALALGYYAFIWVEHGKEFAALFLSGYVLEKSLSVDNLMVFMAIFASFGIKSTHLQHKILLWGIAGAIVFRGVFVAAGTALFNLHWSVQVLFGLIVAWSAVAIIKGGDEEDIDYSKHWAVRLVGKVLPVHNALDGEKFITIKNGIKYATPALLCVFVIELTDIVFSFDSVPAVIGVTQEPLLVYSAMLMAVLGLRALFFVLSVAVKYLVHLEKAVAVVLVFVGAKLMYHPFGETLHAKWSFLPHDISPNVSLMIVLGTLALGVIASFIFPEKEEAAV
ncbi:integral membrane protein [Escherichia phage vB_EcoM-Ro121c4YLVW]|uniref:Integral membrane protein n=1 Tax=Escherichia phage vB_EcoM-Ro121c4YLVW TaxID=2144176 RepID=A0A499Q3I8_9CAUD|nr:membrane protein [Escherichia phage vB_EcoM-Ro121c4YLVW]AVZ45276.1 integral membrane protein [Escherichia phage vB_EcoM-Ro121c4YLVW]